MIELILYFLAVLIAIFFLVAGVPILGFLIITLIVIRIFYVVVVVFLERR